MDYLDHIVQKGFLEQGLFGKRCRSCEFSADAAQRLGGQLSGYREYWSTVRQWTDEDFDKDTVFDIWNLRSADTLLAENKIDLHSLTTDDIPLTTSESPGLSQSERQWQCRLPG